MLWSSLSTAPNVQAKIAFITFTHGALDIPHDKPVLVIKELDSDLGDLQDSRIFERFFLSLLALALPAQLQPGTGL